MVRAGRFRWALGAAIAACLLAALAGAGPSSAERLIDIGPPVLHIGVVATPAPIPTPSQGRIPVSLRLANSIWTDDSSHPSAATEVAFDIDRQFRFDMARVPTCKPTGDRTRPRDESPCDQGKLASGHMKVEVQFPEQEAITVGGQALAYKTGPRSIAIFTFLSAPVTGALLIPVKVSQPREGIYGLTATATVPKLAGGSGSLVYLGLRFRKGIFSAACSSGRLQSGVTNSFVDGSRVAAASILTC